MIPIKSSIDHEYASADLRAALQAIADRFIDRLYYGAERALLEASSIIYPPDITPEREAFACRVRFGSPLHTPALDFADLPAVLASLSAAVMNRLRAGSGAFILNFQRYRRGNVNIPPHFDGEYFHWRQAANGSLYVEHGLRPRYCALLCLENRAPDSATTLIDDNDVRLNFHLRAGDLFIFDNQYYMHCVEPFVWSAAENCQWVRYMIGWRSITMDCKEIKQGIETPISPDYADRLISGRRTPAWSEAPF